MTRARPNRCRRVASASRPESLRAMVGSGDMAAPLLDDVPHVPAPIPARHLGLHLPVSGRGPASEPVLARRGRGPSVSPAPEGVPAQVVAEGRLGPGRAAIGRDLDGPDAAAAVEGDPGGL